MNKKTKNINKILCVISIFSIISVHAQIKNTELEEVTFRESIPLKYPEHLAFITSASPEGKLNVMTIGWYMIAGNNPSKFAIAVRKTHYTHELITKIKEFVLAYPTEDMEKEILFCGTQTGREVDKFKETKLTPTKGKTVKAPLIEECKANFECKVIGTLDGGSHTIFLGEILHSWVNPELKTKRRIYNLGNKIFKGLPYIMNRSIKQSANLTWSQQIISDNSFRTVQFVNSNIGWIAGRSGSIFKTHDGGKTWLFQKSNISNSLLSIYFIDHNTGWAAGADGVIIKTSDSGSNWNTQQSGTSEWLECIHFLNKNTGWAVGYGGTILKTTDGGLHWNIQISGTTLHLKSIFFIDSNIGWAMGQGGTILYTVNSGTNWNLVDIGISDLLRSQFWINRSTGWIVGKPGIIIKTTDYGKNWHKQISGVDVDLRFVFFTNENTGWIVGENGTILYTTDGGQKWHIYNSAINNYLKSIFFIDEHTGWIVGDRGLILKTIESK